jgi:spermidine/putrescine-binding protein
MKRRTFLGIAGGLIGVAIIGGGLYWYMTRTKVPEVKTLRLFTWEEETLDEFLDPFRDAYPNVDLKIGIYGDQDEMITRLRAGYKADVIAPCTDKIPVLRELELIQPIDVSKLEYWDDMFESFKNAPMVKINGDIWFVPTNYGTEGITYRTDMIEREITSWADLFDPEFEGKILMADDPFYGIAIAALILGFDLDPDNDGMWELTEEQLQECKELLIQQKPLVLKYSDEVDVELPQLMAAGEVWISIGWAPETLELLDEGVPVKYVLPEEGALVFVCGNAIVKGTEEEDLAHALVDNYLAPHSQRFFAEEYWYGITNEAVVEELAAEDPDLVENLLLDKPEEALAIGHFEYPIENYDRWEEIWNEVKLA